MEIKQIVFCQKAENHLPKGKKYENDHSLQIRRDSAQGSKPRVFRKIA
jgi:hypothetical protein